MMRKPVVVSLGEVLWDLFPEGERFGGAPANFACHASLQGADVKMVSAVGDDARGREATRILDGYGIDLNHLQTIDQTETGTVGVELDERGKPRYEIHANAAWDRLEWRNSLEPVIQTADVLYFGTLGQRSSHSREMIGRCIEAACLANVPRLVDLNLRAPFYDDVLIRESIDSASILKISDEELAPVAASLNLDCPNDRETLQRLFEISSLDLMVMTRGSEGATLVSHDGFFEQAGVEVDVVDTVGAGDAFTATFLLGYLRGQSFPSILRRACEYAADVCTRSGAVPLPR